MVFMDKVAENAIKMADYRILADDTCPKGITYAQLDNLSGKVYAYLQEQGMGKEDFVMLCLPRGIQPLVAMLGVWKNGSAFVLVEDNYAPERIEFIKKDCGCKLVIDAEVWQTIQTYEAKAGHVVTDEHDAAFAVYTSGTTGNPKGVLQEYGNLDRMIDSITMRTCDQLATSEDRFALVAPLNFVASMLITVYGFYFGVFNYVVPYKTIKNPLLVGMFIISNGITGTFLTPSHIRKMGRKLPGLKFCIIGSEPANEVYMEGLAIHNFYLMSESGFAVTHFLIDQMYEQTPVGDSEFGHEILLLDEQGNPVPDGEEGEICFENKYVRGYLNLPEQTAEAFRDGLYHTGDLARRDEQGRIVICGRLSDMVKINGNRVEPGEIEGVAKKVLKIDWAAARIFDDGNRVFIALYYTAKIKIDEEKVRKEMELYLPYYMIPAFFIHIDEVPLKPNGKMDRKGLPKPDFAQYQEDYVAPRDEIETALCEAFVKVLKMERVGINDDFYQLGGDSLGSMEVIELSKLPGLTATQIFRGHTVEKIAALYKEESAGMEDIYLAEANRKAMKHAQTLTAEQTYMLDYQFYTPKSTMYNLYQMMKFDKDIVEMDKLAACVKTSAMNHPALLTTFFFNEDGEPMQRYSPELWKDIEVEHITEAELDVLKDTLVQPFRIVGDLLFRCRVFETEEAGYLFFDVHHTLFDGTSSKVFFGDILKAYFGQPLEPDYYYYNIRKREKQTWTPFYQESKAYFENRYQNCGIKWQCYPTVDHETKKNDNDEVFIPIPIDEKKYAKVLKMNSLTPNAFFITANILTTAFYNRYRHIMVSWIYNGRNDINEMSSVGLLFRDLPVGVSLTGKMKLTDLYADVVDQINKDIEHSCYAAVEGSGNVYVGDMECILYQDDLREIDDMPGLLGEVEIEQNYAASQNVLDIEILNSKEEGMIAMLDFASDRYDEASMINYGGLMRATVKMMLNAVDREDVTVKKLLESVFTELKLGGFFKKKLMFGWLKK